MICSALLHHMAVQVMDGFRWILGSSDSALTCGGDGCLGIASIFFFARRWVIVQGRGSDVKMLVYVQSTGIRQCTRECIGLKVRIVCHCTLRLVVWMWYNTIIMLVNSYRAKLSCRSITEARMRWAIGLLVARLCAEKAPRYSKQVSGGLP